MDSPVWRIHEALMPGPEIVGIRMVCHIAVNRHAAISINRLMRMRIIQNQLCINRLGALDPHHDHRIRSRCKILRAETLSVTKIRDSGYCLRYVQFPVVFRYLSLRIADSERTQRLVILTVMPLDLALQTLCLAVILGIKRHTDGVNVSGSLTPSGKTGIQLHIHMVRPAFRLPGPQGYIVQ